MTKTIVECAHIDSVKVYCQKSKYGPISVTIPASLILAADTVLRDLSMDISSVLTVSVHQSPNDGPNMWCAESHCKRGWSTTPWGAISELAKKLEEANARQS